MKHGFFEKLKWAFIFWLARRLPDCKTIVPALGESIDRRLSFRERVNIKLHLMTCDACYRYLEQIKFLRKAMHIREKIFVNGTDILRSKMSDDAKERIKNGIEESLRSSV